MNELLDLAYEIVKNGFQDEDQRFPISYVSGWLEANIGELNTLLNQEFYLDEDKNFQPRKLDASERVIFKLMYETHFYNKIRRDVFRGASSTGPIEADWIMLKEGDTTIQRTSKNSIAMGYMMLSRESQAKLDNLVFLYNRGKSGPFQSSIG